MQRALITDSNDVIFRKNNQTIFDSLRRSQFKAGGYLRRHLFCSALRGSSSGCLCITNRGSGYKIHDFIWLLLFFRFFISALLSFSHHDLRSFSKKRKLILLVTCFLHFGCMGRCWSFFWSAGRRCWSRRFFIRIVGSG